MELEKCVKQLLIKEPFYGLFLLNIERNYGDKSNTLCVYRNGINVGLSVNKKFWDTLDDDMQEAVLIHEISHILFKHLTMCESFNDTALFNIAADMEVNSSIPLLQQDPYCYAKRFGFENNLGTKNYYELIQQTKNNQNCLGGSNQKTIDWIDDMSDHSNWKDFQGLSEAEKKLVENQIDYIAKNTAEHCQKNAGKIPGQFSEYINSLFKKKPAIFNWKSYFRRVLGNSIKFFLKSTRYKPSVRFKDQAGNIVKSKPSILIAVDTSGSISNSELEDFFSEIEHVYKSGVAVDVLEFDTKIQHIFKYTGVKTEIKIKGRGGTDIKETYNFYIKNKRKYSSLIVFTDGYLGINLPKYINTIWVITSSGKIQEYPGKVIYIPKNNN